MAHFLLPCDSKRLTVRALPRHAIFIIFITSSEFDSLCPVKMRVAVVGCLHGELDIIYQRIEEMERTENTVIDALLVCGDFQTIRNDNDLRCMAVPDKYKQLGTFYHYYFGEKRASKLTILIGGNHEASNYLQTLPYGGWVAPNMYYLGLCSIVQLGGLRIGGISGIFKFHHAKLGHFEFLPYNNDTMRSAYHMRETEIFKLLQLTAKLRKTSNSEENAENGKNEENEEKSKLQETAKPKSENRSSGMLDVFMSHDWPLNIHQCGNVNYLLNKKPFFRDEVNSGRLGNPLLQPLVHHLRPKHWFAAHLHVGFRATVNHPPNDQASDQPNETVASPPPPQPNGCTQFQALDKVLPRRHFLQVFDISPEGESSDVRLQYDPEWLAILKKTDHLMKIERQQVRDIDIFSDQNKVDIVEEDIKHVYTLFNYDLTIPDNFAPCEPVPAVGVDNDPRRLKNYVNPQTAKLCEVLSIRDPNQMFIDENPEDTTTMDNLAVPPVPAQPNPDAISLSDSEEEAEKEGGESNKKVKLESPLFIIDTLGSRRQ